MYRAAGSSRPDELVRVSAVGVHREVRERRADEWHLSTGPVYLLMKEQRVTRMTPASEPERAMAGDFVAGATPTSNLAGGSQWRHGIVLTFGDVTVWLHDTAGWADGVVRLRAGPAGVVRRGRSRYRRAQGRPGRAGDRAHRRRVRLPRRAQRHGDDDRDADVRRAWGSDAGAVGGVEPQHPVADTVDDFALEC